MVPANRVRTRAIRHVHRQSPRGPDNARATRAGTCFNLDVSRGVVFDAREGEGAVGAGVDLDRVAGGWKVPRSSSLESGFSTSR